MEGNKYLLDKTVSFSVRSLDIPHLMWMCDNEVYEISRGLTWHQGQRKMAAISITFHSHPLLLELNYSYNDKPVRCVIRLQKESTNLRKGHRYFFVCPVSGRKCWKLYLYNGAFVSRYAIPGASYSKQSLSKKQRMMEGCAKNYERKTLRRYGKTHYRGKPTPYGKRAEKRRMKAERANDLLTTDLLKFFDPYLYKLLRKFERSGCDPASLSKFLLHEYCSHG